MPAFARATSPSEYDRCRNAPSTAAVIANSNNRMRQFGPLVESGSERHEAIDTVEFAVKHRPAQHRMSGGVLHRIDLDVRDLAWRGGDVRCTWRLLRDGGDSILRIR